jgi:hypothetical protein
MNRIRLVGLALVAVCAIGVTTAASAGASTFLLLGATTAKLTAKALATQKFVTHAGTVECTTLTTSGEATVKHALVLRATVTYTGCKAFGLAATVSPAEYEFSADGTVTVLKAITIKATECLVTVQGGQTVGPVKYLNNKPNPGEIEIEPSVTNIMSSGTGAACAYALESIGTYTGNSLVAALGGATIEWTA